ncbi:unnamed protein product [Parnassius apollo]|uniref:(apollo) hypothetical protein n=1 Tax=Parnassius apollo TaxID=110799 RepID=A0A8S3W4E7_PARAO|nr:unnamed protein product [Parnassius apollo]
MAITVDKIFNAHRFSGDNALQFLFYLPFGILLMAIRIVLALILWIASIILPDKSGVRQMLSTLACWTFGIVDSGLYMMSSFKGRWFNGER